MTKEITDLRDLVNMQQVELTINKKKLQLMKKNFRVDKIYNILLILKKEIKTNKKFRICKFIAEHRQESSIILAFNKIGLYECLGSCNKPIFKWTGGKPSKEDAKFIIAFLNQKNKERGILR